MTNSYQHLLSQGRIGSLTLRNRIAVPAMGVSMAQADGVCGERIIRYHEEQAKGGVGLIITGVAGVAWPIGGNQLNQIAISDDRFLPGLSALTEAVHAHGAKIAAQLHHGGLVAVLDMLAGRPIWAPSVPKPSKADFTAAFLAEEMDVMAKGTAAMELKVMTPDDIRLVVSQFAAAAIRAKRAGFDAVEIHGGHGYLLSSFISPLTNQRTDDYGGSRENRIRFLLEVLAAVREAVGPDFPMWVKLDSREVGKEGGLTIEDAIWNARQVEAAGANAISVTAYHDTDQPKLHSASHTPHEPGINIPYAARIKAQIAIPVIVSGRIEPEVGDTAIAQGSADFVAMGRKTLADPHLARKLTEGRPQEVLPCIYCYTCISAIYVNDSARCAVNPETGLEYARPVAAGGSVARKRVVVVGGGPGGMETARRLDAMGHEVILLEKGGQLGGTLRFASLAYAANERLLDWLKRQIDASRVDVRLATEATLDLIRQIAPDDVVVASGAIRAMPPIPGADQAHVLSGDDLRQMMLGQSSDELKRKTSWLTRAATKVGSATGLSGNLEFVRKATHGWMPLGKRIVIIGGELVGLELAEFLGERGREVSVLDEQPRLGRGLTIVRRMRLLEELREHGIHLHPSLSDIRIEGKQVRFTDDKGVAGAIDCDHVIVAQGARDNLTLADQLKREGLAVQVVGDAGGVGYIEGAMRGALKAARAIAGQAEG
ncbi:FAD-dependent oxidoreductase [Sphingobium estronivorans]|uniref:oxidoreductase n=1 Tax=Sphingobium estronivorans TaxID=1577690 RepID=UPI00123B88FE|nr:FAD-dependent oxidoreductase [Sphingobium estronivorans]